MRWITSRSSGRPHDVESQVQLHGYNGDMSRQYGSGHSRALRAKLRAARLALGLTQQDVADRIASVMGMQKPLADSTVSAWEKFERHPSVDVFAAWSRVLGLRLIVDIDAADSGRVPVLLQQRTVEVARALDAAGDADFRLIVGMVSRILGMEGEE